MFGERFFIEKTIQKQLKKHRAEFNGSDEEFRVSMNEKLPKAIEGITAGIIEEIWDYCISNKTDLKKRERKISKNIKNNYGAGIKIFEAFIELNSKISSITYESNYKAFDTREAHLKLDTLVSIHVRACQIANEIKTLVANGYADGAHARWRSLHELCVIFLFLYDNDYETVQMFNDYEVIEDWKKAKEYRENYEELNLHPLSDEEWKDIELRRELMIKKYGKDFSGKNGWTIKALPKWRNFTDIEKAVSKDYLRVVYTWASENIHPGVSGIRSKLGLKDNEQNYFLTGPSDYGFLDPVQYTAHSLAEMSNTFLDMEDSMMNKTFRELLLIFQEGLVEEFQVQQEKIEKDSELK
ncbi:MAG TPA: DUF5677 domain-containing protein [Bacteroidia bacterium]|nr:DUF5677 domain-containing protein [Bacteroidia bacterium]